MIPYGRQDITHEDINALKAVLESDFLTQGPQVPAFEDALKQQCHAQHAVAVSSATAALHIACLALGLGKGDWLWTAPNTFVASANCARYTGAKVDFVDIDPETFTLCPNALAKKLQQAEISGTLPKVVVPVALCGQSCAMAEIRSLAERYGFAILEDASHALGGYYQGQPIGNGRYADITVFSFHPVKIITTGEGGAALTNNAELARSMRLLRSHGITRDPEEMTSYFQGDWYYEQISLGYNYRMTDLQAALGVSQSTRIKAYVDARTKRVSHYNTNLSHLALSLPTLHHDCRSSWHLYVVRLQDAAERLRVFQALRTAGIGVNVHYIPVHLQPYYRQFGFQKNDFPISEDYYNRTISLPLHPKLSAQEQSYIIDTLQDLL